MRIDEHEDWIDGFESWEEVWALLQDDWLRIGDVRQRVELSYGYDDLVVVERDRRLLARQRRGLHRLGFRPASTGRLTTWSWDVEQAVRTADLADHPHPLESMLQGRSVLAQPDRVRQLRTRLARASLVEQQTQQVVRDVFRSSPGDLVVVLYREPDGYGQEWDEDDGDLAQLPTG